eukprot:scaffold12932_cov59-Cylindrotheca_fusiformis.AAC.1
MYKRRIHHKESWIYKEERSLRRKESVELAGAKEEVDQELQKQFAKQSQMDISHYKERAKLQADVASLNRPSTATGTR